MEMQTEEDEKLMTLEKAVRAERGWIEYLWSAGKRLSLSRALFIFVNGGHQRAQSAQKKTSEKRGCQ
jgi:hypothetical protein